MTDHLPFYLPVSLEGEISDGKIYSILYYFYKKSLTGSLIVQDENCERRLFMEDQKVIFATSNGSDDDLGSYLLKKKLISHTVFQQTSQFMQKNNIRFGRALIELGFFDYEEIWTWVPNHLKVIVMSFFNIESGNYQISLEKNHQKENILLDLDILSLIVKGMRLFKSKEYLITVFKNIEYLYVVNSKALSNLDLKPFEMHVFDLVRRGSKLKEIIKRSELLEFDTLRLLYLYLILEIISPKKVRIKSTPSKNKDQSNNINISAFHSFEEALHYYNLKYEIIYKVMLKEIGPIAHSLILKAVEDILDNLPTYFQKIQLNNDGTINEELFLKSVWYYNFEDYIGEFLRGLEEILYTEIYTVKKHLGMDYENQVLKWINGIGTDI